MNPALPTIPLNATADLSDRAIFQLSGPDSVRYLNGQVSQDVRLATDSEAVYSLTSNFKGKLEGDFYIRKHEGSILIDTDASQRESLFMRLDKYLIADDAELIDVTDQYALVFATGSSPDFATSAQWKVQRFGVDGVDYLVAKDTQIQTSFSAVDWETVRVTNGVPRWGAELDDTVLPPEANLESSAISYTKGCYTGQEVISRMKSAGKTNRHLVKLEISGELSVPTDFYANAEDVKPAGSIRSIVKSQDQWFGLGYRTRKHQELNAFVTADGHDVVVY